MNGDFEGSATRAVLAPDLFLLSNLDPASHRVFDLWRDGLILPVVTRPLAKRYIHVMHNLGIPGNIIRQWILWFTCPEKAIYRNQFPESESGAFEECFEAARAGGASIIIAANKDWWKEGAEKENGGVKWLSSEELLEIPSAAKPQAKKICKSMMLIVNDDNPRV